MDPTHLTLFCLTIFAVAVLYSCVGHAGASGYIAAMALFAFAPAVIRPTALVLNILVSVVVSGRFYRAGHFTWSLLWPFALASVPCALLGGFLSLPAAIFKILVGAVLLLAAFPFFFRWVKDETAVRPPSLSLALAVGGAIGLLSGLTGVGGGIFLTPLLLLSRWARTKNTAAVSAVFILVNSIAGLVGHLSAARGLPIEIVYYALAVVTGGALGSYLGSMKLPVAAIHRVLGVVLVIAGAKLILA